MQLSRQQQQQFAQKLSMELSKYTMSWDNDLKVWYDTAIHALNYASALTLGIPQDKFVTLFDQEKQGINMNTVAVLCNNLEARTPMEMGVTARDLAKILLLNQRIAQRWTALKEPVEAKIIRELEIMSNKSVILGKA